MKKPLVILGFTSLVALLAFAGTRCFFCKGTGFRPGTNFTCDFCGGKGWR